MSLDNYSFKNKKTGKLCSVCKGCQSKYHRFHYENNKQRYIEQATKQREVFKERYISFKKTLKCVDCGNDDWRVLDFDHIANNKKSNVSSLVRFGSWDKLTEEITKCEVVCSNCHRIRTYNRQNSSPL